MSKGLPKHLETIPAALSIREAASTMHGNGARAAEMNPSVIGAHMVPTWELIAQLADRVHSLEAKAGMDHNPRRGEEE
jgi:hypothetical protein